MKEYTITFNGRKAGAIGIFYWITETVQAESEQEAVLKLYEKYDHITQKKITVKESHAIPFR
jgi:hypothetical protein